MRYDDRYLFRRLTIHLRLLLHKRGTASLVRESRTCNQEHHYAAVALLSFIPVPILCAHGALGEQAFGQLLGCVWPIRFLESVSETARRFPLHRNVFISFLVLPFLPRIGFVYFPMDIRGWHGVHLPAPTVVRDFEQLTISGFGATCALSMGPSTGYISILKLVKFNLFFFHNHHDVHEHICC
jgi:hypothetical protein